MLPKASKALDAAKQLGRKVAAAPHDRSAEPAKATSSAKGVKKSAAVPKASPPVAKVAKAPEKPAKAAKTAKVAKPPRRIEGAGADKFFEEQRALLEEERISYVAQAADLKAEADQLAQEMEPGDIQFDEESGEGATAAVDRERDLALSAQARVEVAEIDHALARIDAGTYGICESCGQPIPRARLKALPHARLCVACKSGGLSRR
ncbi:MAG: TraR/DksA C4-type zinc finger protein [Acidimicrobiales bacterium]